MLVPRASDLAVQGDVRHHLVPALLRRVITEELQRVVRLGQVAWVAPTLPEQEARPHALAELEHGVHVVERGPRRRGVAAREQRQTEEAVDPRARTRGLLRRVVRYLDCASSLKLVIVKIGARRYVAFSVRVSLLVVYSPNSSSALRTCS